MKSRKIDENQSLLIEDGLIQAIKNASFMPETDCTVIDASGLYVMPGLVNMHVHLGDNPDDLPLYLANGVTTIRNMWGHEGFKPGQYLFGTRVFHHLRLKRQIEEGSVIGPDIYTPGAMLDGDPPFFPKFMNVKAVKNTDQIRRIILTQAEKGYDFIKIYSKLSLENFDDIMRIAKEYKMPVAGHVPDAVGLKHALESRMRSVEHLFGFVNPYSPEKNLNDEQIREMAELAASKHVWNCPTLVASERLANVEKQADFEKEEALAYVPERNKRAMRFLISEAKKVFEKAGLTDQQAYMEKLFFIVRQLQSAGAQMLLGTDKSVPYVVAGFSEHMEMELLAHAGLSNYEILRAATVNAAECLGKESQIGTVETGKKANLIITCENPLENLKTLSGHCGVIKSGVYYSRETCNQMLEDIKKRASVK